ncbi:hypothetical protein AX14_006394 [Amanita brunnescens Koide BX004]|nr:hypothetical protein AX14_006394 [Amanita brunnescens Koide BX004]
MASSSGPPPGLSRPKTRNQPLKSPTLFSSHPFTPLPIVSPILQRAVSTSLASSLAVGLFPATFSFPLAHTTQPASGAVQPAERLPQAPLLDNTLITDLTALPPPLSGSDATMELVDNTAISDLAGIFPPPSPMDPWHRAHARNCAHAVVACAACSISLICCSCRSLRFTPGPAPVSPATASPARRSLSASPALFRTDVGNGPPPPGFDSHEDGHDDDAYVRALAEADTCDNSSCPNGPDAPARYTITVEAFDDGAEEFYDRHYHACAACNRSCKKSFLGERIKARHFDNSTRDKAFNDTAIRGRLMDSALSIAPLAMPSTRRHGPIPGSTSYAREHPTDTAVSTGDITNAAVAPPAALGDPSATSMLQNALRVLNTRPPTPAAFVATVRVKHDAIKPWLPSDTIVPQTASLAQRFRGGAGTDTVSSPEPDIWTPSPRSSPDEIDDLTARAALPLPASHSGSEASRASSRASSVDVPVNVAATPLPTPDYSAIIDEHVDGLLHPSFPDRAVLDDKDRRHFLGRGDLSVTSLKLYARRIFTDTSHWITAGHFLIDVFQGCTLNGSRDDFRRFVILVGTQLGFGDVAISMSESLDVNKKMADEYMRLHDVATTWKQKAKANSKDAKNGRKAQDDLEKARDDIAAILEERQAVLEERKILIQQRHEFLAKDDQLTTELNRVHKDYGNAIEDNAKFAANIETLEQNLSLPNITETRPNKTAAMPFFALIKK